VLKRIPLALTIIYSTALAYVSLVKLNDVPDIGVSFGDKIFHFLAYSILTFLWFGTFFFNFNLKKRRAITYSVIISIMFGIIVEVLQDQLTTYRSMDIYDVLANTFGVLLALLIIVLKRNFDVKIK